MVRVALPRRWTALSQFLASSRPAAAAIVAEFIDYGISEAKGRDKRPQFDALLDGIAQREFDRVAAWSVDRLGRSLSDLVRLLEDLQAKRVDLYLHQQALGTATPFGRMAFGMCSVFAAF
jgi:DNA invertase Pin-like site-specific DNA recombinase